jgi:hypothetical protein
MRVFEDTMPGVMTWSPEAAATLAQAAWVARCARHMAEIAGDVELEQARAVAQALGDDEQLRRLSPEAAAERMVRGR